MVESDNVPTPLTSEMMTEYSALGNDLRFHADQRFKIAGAFLVANTLLANVAKDHQAFGFSLIGIVLSYLCLSWDRYTSGWWWALAETLEDIEKKGIKEGKLVSAYSKYRRLPKSHSFSIRRPLLRASQAVTGIYLLSMVVWAIWWWWVLGVLVFIVRLMYGLVKYPSKTKCNTSLRSGLS